MGLEQGNNFSYKRPPPPSLQIAIDTRPAPTEGEWDEQDREGSSHYWPC